MLSCLLFLVTREVCPCKCRAAVVTWLTLVLSGVAMAAQQTTTPAPAAQPGSTTSSSTSTPQASPPGPPAAPQTINPNTPEMSSREELSPHIACIHDVQPDPMRSGCLEEELLVVEPGWAAGAGVVVCCAAIEIGRAHV